MSYGGGLVERRVMSASECQYVGADAELGVQSEGILYHPDEVPPDSDGA